MTRFYFGRVKCLLFSPWLSSFGFGGCEINEIVREISLNLDSRCYALCSCRTCVGLNLQLLFIYDTDTRNGLDFTRLARLYISIGKEKSNYTTLAAEINF